MRNGFTLVEILMAILIVGILVAMAVPMYEKTIEKSRIAEARSTLKRIHEAKRRVLDMQDTDTYSTLNFGFENLDFTFDCSHGTSTENNHVVACSTKDFTFVLNPAGASNQNAVCAARRTGDNRGVNLLYKGEDEVDADVRFLCNDGNVTGASCDAFGLTSVGTTVWCTPN